ncbi:MAG TPA: FixH family protein [Nitrospirota bacterium]|nr:FixH family protein [Nitrospirota bacterium]
MKKFAIVAIMLILSASVVYANGYEVTKKTGEFDVKVTFDKKTPTASDNAVSIAVKDASGKPVTDAKVKVDYSMPAMSGMPPMNYKTEAALQGEEYKATLGLSMSGSWNIAVKITRAGKTATMKFTVDAK